jgi:hypothetical protein
MLTSLSKGDAIQLSGLFQVKKQLFRSNNTHYLLVWSLWDVNEDQVVYENNACLWDAL